MNFTKEETEILEALSDPEIGAMQRTPQDSPAWSAAIQSLLDKGILEQRFYLSEYGEWVNRKRRKEKKNGK